MSPPGTPNAGTVFVSYDSSSPYSAKPDVVQVFAPNLRLLRTVTVGNGAGPIAVVPAGVPGAGTAYVLDQGQNMYVDAGNHAPQVTLVTEIGLDGTTRTFSLPQTPQALAIAPKDTPNAGTVYVVTFNGEFGSLVSISPDGTLRTIEQDVEDGQIAIAPAGTPYAGTVYVSVMADSYQGIREVPPRGPNPGPVLYGLGDDGVIEAMAIAGPGTPHPGRLYVAGLSGLGDNSYKVLATDGPKQHTVVPHVGTDVMALAVSPQGSSAGTLYAVVGSALLRVSPSGIPKRTHFKDVGRLLAIAPRAVPDAGTLFLNFGKSAGMLDSRGHFVAMKPNSSFYALQVYG